MKTILVSTNNSISLEGGKVGYGVEKNYGQHKFLYEVRLSSSASRYAENGDYIVFWDCGKSDWAYQGCKGVIYKPSNKTVIALKGARDLGIHTGHPTHLGLQMSSRPGLIWDSAIPPKDFPMLPEPEYKEKLTLEDIHNYFTTLNFSLPSNWKVQKGSDPDYPEFYYVKKTITEKLTNDISSGILDECYWTYPIEEVPFAYFDLW